MEQFRRIGEVLGSLKSFMVLKDDIQFNQRQCCLLYDILCLAFDTIAEEIRDKLKLEEKNTKWKALDQPLKEIHRIFKEGELYIKHCFDAKDWLGKVISLHQNKDCVEFHVHNLITCFPAIIEAIESAAEVAGTDETAIQKWKVMHSRKYEHQWNDPELFQWRFGKQYLIPKQICYRLETAWKEDRWQLIEKLKENTSGGSMASKPEQKLGDLLLTKLNGSGPSKLLPSSVLLGSKDYQVRRRLGGGSQYKEIQWLGESFVLRHFYGEAELVNSEVSTFLSLSHPNILQYLCGFCEEEKKEYFLVMELMNKDLGCYIREICGPRRRIPLSLPVAVDIMLQIARGMAYLHSQQIFHGDLNPSNIFIKSRNCSEGYFHVKVSGFGLSSSKSPSPKNSPGQKETETNTFIWHAPEVLEEQEQKGNVSTCRGTEKADVYSFGMVCFELLTGKVPFEDSHLQGEKTSRNIRAGERPLFPYTSPKYLVNLTKKCWHTDPSQRPTFSSICRILQYTKKFLVMNPEHDQRPEVEQIPTMDFCDIEAWFLKKFDMKGACAPTSVSQIPFQLFAYRIAEKDKTGLCKDRSWDSISDAVSVCKDDTMSTIFKDDSLSAFEYATADTKSVCSDMRSVYSEAPLKTVPSAKKKPAAIVRKGTGSPKTQSPRSSLVNSPARNARPVKTNRDHLLPLRMSPLSLGQSPGRRRTSGHVSDSELR